VLLSKTVRSSTLKLALVYIGIFSSAIFGLLAYIYWSMGSYLAENLDRATRGERDLLVKAYDVAGRGALIALINERINDGRLTGWVYELTDASATPIAGNLPRWPEGMQAGTDWSAFATFEDRRGAAEQRPLRVTFRKLPDGSHLLLGRQVDGLDGFTGTMATTLLGTGALFLILAAAAGISTAGRSVTRIETINATSREIMRSGLGTRIPLRGTGDEWDELAGNLNSMLDRIEQLVETNRQVSDNIAHDLRTPLTRMRARLERTVMEPLGRSGYQSLVNDTIVELDTILRTFSSMLRISRIEASDDSLRFRRLDLCQMAGEVVELFDAVAEESSVRLILSGKEAPIVGDRDLLFDAISNLVDNAIKHGGEGGEVQVAIGRTIAGAVLSVADRGPGVPASERQHVFERFYRLERSRKSPGNGLGLSLVSAVAKLHNAQIEMADNLPGLRIEVRFPPPTDIVLGPAGAEAHSPSR
jgi:signal transduction histidine kinase